MTNRKKVSCKDCEYYSNPNYKCGPFGNQAKYDNCEHFGTLYKINDDAIDCFYFSNKEVEE